MRSLALVVLVLGAASTARAAMMTHTDLTSLALSASVVVRATRTGGPDEAATYRVDGVLAGRGLTTGQTFTVDRRLYVDPPGVEPIAYLFLERRASEWLVVGSGLRAIAGGRAYRFEQRSNPGPYVAVRQGRDPEDARGEETTAHLTRAELERAIERVIPRAERARAAIAGRDAAAVLALLPPARDPALPRVEPMGFYRDTVASRAYRAFVEAGEVDAALDVYTRTRGERPSWPPIDEAPLLERIESDTTPLARRVAAIELLSMTFSQRALDGLVALARSDGAGPVRAAAIARLAGSQNTTSSEAEWAEVRRRARRELTTMIRTLLPREPEASVRVALSTAAGELSISLPRGAEPLAVVVAREGDRAVFTMASSRDIRRIELVRPDGSRCAEPTQVIHSRTGSRGALPLAECPPDARLLVEIARGRSTTAQTFPLTTQ